MEILKEVSRTFNEYLLLPNLTTRKNLLSNVSLKTPLVRFKKGQTPKISLNAPIVSAIMQAVSSKEVAVDLARAGGISFLNHSQSIESQANMVRSVKAFKAGYVQSDSNISPKESLHKAIAIAQATGHNTIAVTEDGTPNGKLVGLLTSRDYRPGHVKESDAVRDFMTPLAKLVVGKSGMNLSDANAVIWENKLNCLPLVDKSGHLDCLIFRKDYEHHKLHPNELVDSEKRLRVGAGINSRDFEERVPALIKAGVDVLCVDSSDGFNEWQADTIKWVKKKYKGEVLIGGGNVVDDRGFEYLVGAGADFIKVGVGGGSICITREQKGIGRGQASALIDVVNARNSYFKKKGEYIPVCSDGGIIHDYHMTLALAMGSDFLMLGRYFARFEQSPTKRVKIGTQLYKEYWGEGTERAKNWERYDMGGDGKLMFEEGVDGYVPFAGDLTESVDVTLNKIKTTMCNCGSLTLPEFTESARLVQISQQSFLENAHQIQLGPKDEMQMA